MYFVRVYIGLQVYINTGMHVYIYLYKNSMVIHIR